jgi:hypothetical protein
MSAPVMTSDLDDLHILPQPEDDPILFWVGVIAFVVGLGMFAMLGGSAPLTPDAPGLVQLNPNGVWVEPWQARGFHALVLIAVGCSAAMIWRQSRRNLVKFKQRFPFSSADLKPHPPA